MLAPQKESIFGCSCRLWLLSWRRARIFARSCSLLSKYLPISWKQRKEQSHAQCHVTHRIRIFDKISEHVKVAKSVDIAVPELAVTVARSTRVVPVSFVFLFQMSRPNFISKQLLSIFIQQKNQFTFFKLQKYPVIRRRLVGLIS